MADPYGLAYGIGAGFANVPGAFQQGKEDTIRLAMAQLALQQAQKQQEMEDATSEIIAKPRIDPFTQAPQAPVDPSVAISGGGTNADGTIVPRSAMPRGFDPMNPMATSQDVANDPTASRRGLAPKTIQPLANPNVVQAHKLLMIADDLDKAKNWRVAQQYREHARSLGEKGIQEVRQTFGQMIAGGRFDEALSALHGMGIQSVSAITPDPSGEGILMHNADGTTYSMDEDALTKFVNPNLPPKSAYDLVLRREELARKKAADEVRARQGDRRLDISQKGMELRDALGWAKLSMEKNKAALGLGGPKTPAKIIQWQYEAAQEKALNPSLSDAEIWKIVRGRDEAGQLKMGTAITSMLKLADNVSGEESKKILADVSEMIGSSKVVKAAKSGKPGEAKKNYEGEVSPSGKYIFKNGAWVSK